MWSSALLGLSFPHDKRARLSLRCGVKVLRLTNGGSAAAAAAASPFLASGSSSPHAHLRDSRRAALGGGVGCTRQREPRPPAACRIRLQQHLPGAGAHPLLLVQQQGGRRAVQA